MGRIFQLTTEGSIARYVFSVQFATGKKVLDIGCSCGYGIYLLSQEAKLALGCDFDYDLLSYAMRQFNTSRTSYIKANATTLPFRDASFDTIVTHHLIEHLDDPERFLKECHRVLGEQGVFVCSTPNREFLSSVSGMPQHSDHIQEFSPRELTSILKSYFNPLYIYGKGWSASKFTYRINYSVVWVMNKLPFMKTIFPLFSSFVPDFIVARYHWMNVNKVKCLSQEHLSKFLLRYNPIPVFEHHKPEELMAVGEKSGSSK